MKNLIGICCILFCILVYFSVAKEENITIKDYEWEETMEIVREYREMKEEEFGNFYNEIQDTIKIESIEEM